MSATTVTGLLAVAAVLVLSTVFGLLRRRNDGRVRRASALESADVLSAEDIGELGRAATLVQFSTEWCQPCRAVRRILGEIADTDAEDVRHVEIDAEERLDLVRRFDITRTPTVLVLDHVGGVVARIVGVPRVPELRAQVAALVPVA